MKNISLGKDAVTIISTGVVIEGKLRSDGNVRMDGIINGDLNAIGNITIGEHGQVNGHVTGQTITLGGKVFGSINAEEKVILETKSILKGDLITKILIVEEGAEFVGNSKMSINKENLES